jgi:predicted dithiol-disulfide oxidoreductase (DUF899 family)
MSWTFPWASSVGGDFNFDFCASYTEEQQCKGIEYNFTREPELLWRPGQEGGGQAAVDKFAAMCGTDAPTYQRERPGVSTFALEDGIVYRTIPPMRAEWTVSREMYQWLDRAPKGRNETGVWWKRHDGYGK